MMKVKTLKDHGNDYGVAQGLPFHKSSNRIYEIESEEEAQVLIDAGLVKAVKGKA